MNIDDISTFEKFLSDKNISLFQSFIDKFYELGYVDEDFVDVIDVIENIMNIEKDFDVYITDDLGEKFLDKKLIEIKLLFTPYIRENKLKELGL